MALDIKVPALPESVADATVARWHKKAGDAVKRDENLVDIETDKVVLEVVAPADGVLSTILKPEGSIVLAQEVIGRVDAGVTAATTAAPVAEASTPAPMPMPTTPPPVSVPTASPEAGPAARRMLQENAVSPADVTGTGKGGRITTEDVSRTLAVTTKTATPAPALQPSVIPVNASGRLEERVPMTRLRAKIAERLLQSQRTNATLTTFNEINMGPVMKLRAEYKEAFEKKHGVRLGMMSFFVKAVVQALKRFPMVNASIDGNDIVYHGYFDIGVAVSSPRGLVVPILRDADQLSLAAIEKQIALFGQKAKDGTLSIEEMTGGTFTISNGGIFGSLLSTPILNPPQSAILGMHKIEDRPVVVEGQIVIRPMMYVALSYDHRLIDGAESVRFLVTIKEMVEDPSRLLLDV